MIHNSIFANSVNNLLEKRTAALTSNIEKNPFPRQKFVKSSEYFSNPHWSKISQIPSISHVPKCSKLWYNLELITNLTDIQVVTSVSFFLEEVCDSYVVSPFK